MDINDIHLKQLLVSIEAGEVQEGLILFPEQKEGEKSPLVVFIHGHNTGGGWELLAPAQRMTKRGYAVLMPSQIGFGLSTGKRDYCGPKTVAAIAKLIEAVLAEYPQSLDPNKVVVWGVSRGATVASALVVDHPALFAAGILVSGVYDMEMNAGWSGKDPEILRNLVEETGGTPEAYRLRSSVGRMNSLRCPLLILHGDSDDVVSVEQALLLDRKLLELGKEHETVVVKGGRHHIGGPAISREYVFPFLERILQK
ncbi:MAG TPA: alpha/beta fold hydrolase [Candidatus Paceibacterota bacterium]|nr:alpha/beta fold hydrolase [Candidatus Paceibacterota bacterium]